MTSKPSRPLMRYFGGKWRAAPWIISHFPPHVTYVEPFAGAASVLLQEEPSQLEYLNDLDGEVVNLFRVMRDRGAELIRAIELTPYSRREFEASFEAATDPVERARRMYVRSWQGRCAPKGGGAKATGWRFQRTNARGHFVAGDWSNTEYLDVLVERLKKVGLECGDAFEVLERFDHAETLFYVDPPYLGGQRDKGWRRYQYNHEFASDQQHLRLLGALQGLEAMVVLSGYRSTLYAETLRDWRMDARSVATQAGSAEECIWLNPAAQRGMAQRTLFPVEA